MLKKILTLGLCIGLSSLFAQVGLAQDTLEINTLKVKVLSDGSLVEMETLDNGSYKSLMYTQNLWFGGIDINNNLRLAQETYHLSTRTYWPGPLSQNPNSSQVYDKVYPMSVKIINDFLANPNTIPNEIANWPAHGDTSFGEDYYLAPFVDVNKDGKYEPSNGDYPQIKGDAAIYTICHDPISTYLEIHSMTYGFHTNDIQDSILYTDYTIINRSGLKYIDSYISIFADFDNGNPADDLLGTNIMDHSIFAYNGDYEDEGPTGFGFNMATSAVRMIKGPPADYFDGLDNDMDGCIDAVLLPNGTCAPEDPIQKIQENITMSGSMYYNNSLGGSPQGNPLHDSDYYNYMQSLWLNGHYLMIENPSGFLNNQNGDGFFQTGTTPTTFMYPGNSYDTTGAYHPFSDVNWFASPSTKADQRALANCGPFTMEKNEKFTVTTAFIWTRSDSGDVGYSKINNLVGNFDQYYKNQPKRYVSLTETPTRNLYQLFFDTHDAAWRIENPTDQNLSFEIYNIQGQKIKEFYVEAYSSSIVPSFQLSPSVYVLHEKNQKRSNKIIVH